MTFKLAKPVMAIGVFEPDMSALKQWENADPKFLPDRMVMADQNGDYLLVNSLEKMKTCMKSLRKAIATVNDKRKTVWLCNFLRSLEGMRKAEPIWHYDVIEVTLRVRHEEHRELYKSFIKLSFVNSDGANVKRAGIEELRKRLRAKFKLTALPPTSIVTDLIKELKEEEEAQKTTDIQKQAAREAGEEMKLKYEARLAEMQEKLDKMKEVQQAPPPVVQYQPLKVSVPDLSPYFTDAGDNYLLESEIVLQDITTVAVATPPGKGTFAFALLASGKMVPLCRPLKNRFRTDKVVRHLNDLLCLPALEMCVPVPQPEEEE